MLEKELEFKNALQKYQSYLENLKAEKMKKLESENPNFFSKFNLNSSIKKYQKLLELITKINELDGVSHFSMESFIEDNKEVIVALRNMPKLGEEKTSAIIKSYINEESKVFESNKDQALLSRESESELINALISSSTSFKIDKIYYQNLKELFESSLNQLSVFDLKLDGEHQVISNDEVTKNSSLVSMLILYKEKLLTGEDLDIKGLNLENIDTIIGIVICNERNKIYLKYLENLSLLIPPTDVKTIKLIKDTAVAYQEKIKRVKETLKLDFSLLEEKLKAMDGRKKEETSDATKDNYPNLDFDNVGNITIGGVYDMNLKR